MRHLVMLALAILVALPGLPGCGSEDDDTNSPVCGNGTCEAGENATTCAADCPSAPVCGDGTCSAGETTGSCPGDCPANPMCGDGTCNGAETTATCPGDCPCTNNTSANDTCTGETVCVNGQCVAAFGRVYKVVVANGQLQPNNAAGETWDAAGGLPDPFVTLTLNGTVLGSTTAVQDTLTPSWLTQFSTVVPGGSTLVLQVYDEDVAANDYMFGCMLQPVTADALRAYTLSCPSFAGDPAGVGSQVLFWFEYQ